MGAVKGDTRSLDYSSCVLEVTKPNQDASHALHGCNVRLSNLGRGPAKNTHLSKET